MDRLKGENIYHKETVSRHRIREGQRLLFSVRLISRVCKVNQVCTVAKEENVPRLSKVLLDLFD